MNPHYVLKSLHVHPHACRAFFFLHASLLVAALKARNEEGENSLVLDGLFEDVDTCHFDGVDLMQRSIETQEHANLGHPGKRGPGGRSNRSLTASKQDPSDDTGPETTTTTTMAGHIVQTWIINFGKGAKHSAISFFCAFLQRKTNCDGNGDCGVCLYVGNPENRGLPILVVSASLDQLSSSVAWHEAKFARFYIEMDATNRGFSNEQRNMNSLRLELKDSTGGKNINRDASETTFTPSITTTNTATTTTSATTWTWTTWTITRTSITPTTITTSVTFTTMTTTTTTTSTTNTSTTTLTSHTTSTTTTTIVLTWSLDRIDDRWGLDGSFEDGGSGSGIRIYHFDSGVDWTHIEFTGGRAVPAAEVYYDYPGPILRPCQQENYWDDYGCGYDYEGHGTHTAAISIGTVYGVAKFARLHAIKIMNNYGVTTTAGLIQGIDHALQIMIKPCVFAIHVGNKGVSRILADAVNTVIEDNGVSVVVAAGNEAANGGNDACLFYPANSGEKLLRASGMNEMNQRDARSNYGPCVDIWAPGTAITSAKLGNITLTKTGSSMAAAHVAGFTAGILTFVPTASPAYLKHAVTLMAMDGMLDPVTIYEEFGSPNKMLYTRRARYFFGIAGPDANISFMEWWARMDKAPYAEALRLFNAVDEDGSMGIDVEEFNDKFKGVV